MTTQSEMNGFVETIFGNLNYDGKKIMKRGRKPAAQKKSKAEKLKVGDIVELKCGSPSMVVVHVHHDRAGDVSCSYYESGFSGVEGQRGFQTKYFPEAALHKREHFSFELSASKSPQISKPRRVVKWNAD